VASSPALPVAADLFGHVEALFGPDDWRRYEAHAYLFDRLSFRSPGALEGQRKP
jgi:hypothetical protein